VVSTVGIVPIPLYLLRWNGNVLPVFSAVNVLDFSRVAVRLIATANGRIIGHLPFGIKPLVQELILWRMVVQRSLALSIFLRSDWHRQ
jgi:hypothetical protein